jgi:branched-chain amino acid transport system permease protein
MESITLTMTSLAIAWVTFLWWLNRSPFGRKLAALAEQEWHAQALGISRVRTHLSAFLISSIGVTVAIIFYSQYIRLLHPNDYLFPALIFYVMCVVAGKPGSVWGVTLATTLLVLLKEGLRFVPLEASLLGPLRLMLFGAILFVAVWLRRDTLFPQQRRV